MDQINAKHQDLVALGSPGFVTNTFKVSLSFGPEINQNLAQFRHKSSKLELPI